MVSFRRIILAMAVLALCVGIASAQIGTSTGVSSGGPLSCSAAPAATPQLRGEGMTELVGDILITCTGGTPVAAGTPVGTANIVVNLTVPVTSRILSNTGSEALLLIDEPGTTLAGPGAGLNQVVCANGSAINTCATPSFTLPTGFAASYAANGAYEACGTSYNTTTGICSSVPNVFQGQVLNTYQVVFNGIPILAPATAGFSRIFRITNIRGDVAALGSPGLSTLATVNAYISVSGTNPFSLLSPSVSLGSVQTGLSASVRNAPNSGTSSPSPNSLNYLQCNNVGSSSGTVPSTSTSSSNVSPGAVLRFSENFATAFKARNSQVATTCTSTTGISSLCYYASTTAGVIQTIPGFSYLGSESGLEVSTPTTVPAGLADFGTRLRAVFNNVPAGVSIWVTTTNILTNGNNNTVGSNVPLTNTTATYFTNSSLYTYNNGGPGILYPIAQLVASETAPDFNGQVPFVNPSTFLNSGSLALYQVPVSNGTAEAVWEVVNENPSANDILDFGVFFTYVANQNTNTPPVGTGSVGFSYAPAPNTTGLPPTFTATAGAAASSSLPIPRFADTTANITKNIVTISLCQTTILLPFITNENGLETGISVANTTTDTFGTSPQNGTCAMTFYGDNAGPSTTTAPCTSAGACLGGAAVNSGKVFAATLTSILGSSFQGYAIITCNFQYAHAFAFISDTHATQIAMGYLGLVFDGGGNIARGGNAEALAN